MSGIFDQVINYSPPSLLKGTVTYKGTWSAATNTPTLINPPDSTTNGFYYVVSAAGTQFSLVFNIGDWIISNGSAWEKVDNTDAVDSVFGRTGAVVGVSTDYSAVGITNTALGASNPSTVAATTITASSTIAATGAVTGSNLSGTNTGDQTITLTGGVTGSGTGSFAATVVTNANLTGVITSVGNATSIASQTGTGTKFVVDTSPTLVTPNIGVATGTSLAAALNGTLGATTPSSVAATTGTFSSTLGVTGVATLGNGAILGTPASGTVTNLTGTASININGTVGATTPSTVAATTISATGGTITGTSGPLLYLDRTNVGTAALRINALTGSNPAVELYRNGALVNSIFSSGADLVLYNSGNVAVVSSTGLAVTGTLSATGNVTSTTGVFQSVTGTGVRLSAPNNTSATIGVDGGNQLVVNGYSPVTISTGLAVTGTLSATDTISTTKAVASAGNIVSIKNSTDTGGDNTRYAGVNFLVGSDDGTSSIRSYRTNSATNYETALAFLTNPSGATQTPTEKMRIDSSGNVGIGTTSGGAKLTVQADATYSAEVGILRLETATDTNKRMYLGYDVTVNAGYIQAQQAGTNWKPLMLNPNAGDVLIGTTTTLNANIGLSVKGSQSSGGAGIITGSNIDASAGDSSPVLVLLKSMTTTTSSARFVQFYANGTATAMGGIVGNGASNVQFAAISDAREKTNVQALEGSLAKIFALKPVAFDWIKSGEHINSGFIAQDVEKVFPEFVVSNMSNEGEEQRYGLTGGLTSGIIPHIVAALQELKLDNDSLRKRLAALESK